MVIIVYKKLFLSLKIILVFADEYIIIQDQFNSLPQTILTKAA